MAKYFSGILFLLAFIFIQSLCEAQLLNNKQQFNRQDSLRGSITPERAWWNVTRYNISVAPDYKTKTIKGWNEITFEPINYGKNKIMQIDLQQPMTIDSVKLEHTYLIKNIKREGNVYFIDFGDYHFTDNAKSPLHRNFSLWIYFSGKPREAVNPPWDGGWIFSKDAKGRPWMTVACQGLGASVWFPCKDHQSDEPDRGASLTINIHDSLIAVGNGRLTKKKNNADGTTSWTWSVSNPINNYNIVPYIGSYVNFNDTLNGEKGKLDLSYWVLDYNLDKAKKHFGRDVKPALRAFEFWFGPYPFYEDGFKLVESSHQGMEHQSAIAYGNRYMNGYLGMDLSGSGWGKSWDYIIVHEMGHEWFGNNITTNDIADMWVHEGFTDYSETLFVEMLHGKEAANAYTQGLRKNIQNQQPVTGIYGVNNEGSGDMYYKGNNLIHTIRQVINNDSVFRKILRGLNIEFYQKTIDSKDVEKYISDKSGIDLSKIFDQYLRTTKIPVLEYKTNGPKVSYRWTNCVENFDMPLRLGEGRTFSVSPVTKWQEMELPSTFSFNDINRNFYITVKKVE